MALNEQFETDATMEVEGVITDYGNDRIKIARAGGANKRYIRMLDLKTKPFRRAIQARALDNDRSTAILQDVYAHTVILGWQVNKGTLTEPKWVEGIDPKDAGEDGEELLAVNPENILKVFRNLPDLFLDMQEQATTGALYRAELAEQAAGNS